ncbi:MAG: hypothetical protein V3U32_07315 [Anaerolineales bacterium]
MSRLLAFAEIHCDIIGGVGGTLILAFIGLSLAVLFIVLYRSGILEELPRLLSGNPEDGPVQYDPEEERRLEVFKDFFEDDSDKE